MPIRDVRRHAAPVRAGDGNVAERLEPLHAHRQQVLTQLAQATAHLDAIDIKIGLYEQRLAADAELSA